MLISSTFPFRLTRHLILEDSSWSLTKAFSEPYSDIVEIKDATNIATAIPIVSNISKCLNKNITLTASTINNTLIIGSPKVSINK